VAEKFNTNHHEFLVKPDVAEDLPGIVWFLDEPLFDNSIFPTHLISKLTRDYVKVVLSGDGGDELFAGYQWTRRYEFYRQYNKLPSLFREGLNRAFLDGRGDAPYGRDFKSKAARFLYDTTLSFEDGFARRTSVDPRIKEGLYSERLTGALRNFDPLDIQKGYFNEASVKDEREKMLYVDSMMFLPDDILFKVDRMSMAHSLEVRVPLLDHKLVELAASIPFNYKIKGFKTKYIFKTVLEGLLPQKVLKQRKQGFTLPFGEWLRGEELKNLASSLLLGKRAVERGFFNGDYIKGMLDAHASGKQDFSHRIMGLIIFETWARLFLDSKSDTVPSCTLSEML
jgi:asparagine synthase (glutamine-hydrolysing)